MAAVLLGTKAIGVSIRDTVILDQINISIHAGDVMVVLGPSGAGKTTLLKCLNLLTLPTNGQIALGDQVVFSAHDAPRSRLRQMARRVIFGTDMRPEYEIHQDLTTYRRNFGVVFQEFNLWPHMTLFDNIAAPLRWVGSTPRREIAAAVEARAELVGIQRLLRRYPSEVSGGERQRAAIARALIGNPRILLLDEITSALDPERVLEVLGLIERLKESGHTMVVVTHYVRFAHRIATAAAFMVGGRMVEAGPADKFFTAPRTEELQKFLSRFAEL